MLTRSVALAALPAFLAVASTAQAQTFFSQDFSSNAIGSHESVGGDFAVDNGYVGNQTPYGNNEFGSYSFSTLANGDLYLNFDYNINTENGFDNLQVVVNNNILARYSGCCNIGRANLSLGYYSGLVTVAFNFSSDSSVTFRGVQLDNIDLSRSATSTPSVPEPASWGMLILGFGAVGFAMRRRVRASEVKFGDRIKLIAAGEIA